jgi:hypothetical protein
VSKRTTAGLHTQGDIARCMVDGCKGKAIYRNPGSVASTKTMRGYCSTHRELAVPRLASSSVASQAKHCEYGNRVEWRILVDDEGVGG